MLKTLRTLALVAVMVPVIASADDRDGRRHRRSVPEFDPATVGVVAALVAGGGLLVARRRRR